MYMKELEGLREQNMRLAENTKLIEERYMEVSELAKKALKPTVNHNASPIMIEDSSEIAKVAHLAKKTPKASSIVPQTINPTASHQDNLDRGESTKTLPKKPPVKLPKEKTKKKLPKNEPVISDRKELSPPPCELKPNSTSRRDHRQPYEEPSQVSGGRYLIPRRGIVKLTKATR